MNNQLEEWNKLMLESKEFQDKKRSEKFAELVDEMIQFISSEKYEVVKAQTAYEFVLQAVIYGSDTEFIGQGILSTASKEYYNLNRENED